MTGTRLRSAHSKSPDLIAGIPASHIEKVFWVTEVFLGALTRPLHVLDRRWPHWERTPGRWVRASPRERYE